MRAGAGRNLPKNGEKVDICAYIVDNFFDLMFASAVGRRKRGKFVCITRTYPHLCTGLSTRAVRRTAKRGDFCEKIGQNRLFFGRAGAIIREK